MERGDHSTGGTPLPGPDPWASLTAGYRFLLAEEPHVAAAALDLRALVYKEKLGQPIPVPDEFDERAWLLAAEHRASGRIVGTMRLAPHDRGAFECEQFFDLPLRVLQSVSVELTRFAVHREHRRNSAALPPVSIGLFRMVMDICGRIDTDWLVIASRPSQIATYDWLGFQRTGIEAKYGSLADATHELLFGDYKGKGRFEGHAMREFLVERPCPDVVLPDELPEPGAWLRRLRRGRAATAGVS